MTDFITLENQLTANFVWQDGAPPHKGVWWVQYWSAREGWKFIGGEPRPIIVTKYDDGLRAYSIRHAGPLPIPEEEK